MRSHDHKIFFQHIPKCAGSSILEAFKQYNKENNTKLTHIAHEPLSSFLLESEEHTNWFKFTFVRNPWDRTVSAFNYRKKAIKDCKKYPHWQSYEEIKNDDFKTTLLKDRDNKNPVVHYLEGPFWNWWFNPSIISKFDYIGKYENLHEDFDNICKLSNLPKLKLPHVNKTTHRHYTEYYDDETREIIANRYATDIEYFGYEFGK